MFFLNIGIVIGFEGRIDLMVGIFGDFVVNTRGVLEFGGVEIGI